MDLHCPLIHPVCVSFTAAGVADRADSRRHLSVAQLSLHSAQRSALSLVASHACMLGGASMSPSTSQPASDSQYPHPQSTLQHTTERHGAPQSTTEHTTKHLRARQSTMEHTTARAHGGRTPHSEGALNFVRLAVPSLSRLGADTRVIHQSSIATSKSELQAIPSSPSPSSPSASASLQPLGQEQSPYLQVGLAGSVTALDAFVLSAWHTSLPVLYSGGCCYSGLAQ